MKTIDFTDIDVYPRHYECREKNGQKQFVVRSLIIENIERQQQALLSKKTQLLLGDCIKVDFKFGHNVGVTEEEWLDVYVSGKYKVTKIIPHNNEIELVVRHKRS